MFKGIANQGRCGTSELTAKTTSSSLFVFNAQRAASVSMLLRATCVLLGLSIAVCFSLLFSTSCAYADNMSAQENGTSSSTQLASDVATTLEANYALLVDYSTSSSAIYHLVFAYSEEYPTTYDGHSVIAAYQDFLNYEDYPEWDEYSNYILQVDIIDPIAPLSTYGWFSGYRRLAVINGLENIDTSNTTNMADMFCNCASLKSIDVSNFDTSNVIDMSYMFYNCIEVAELDVSNFDTSNVTNMEEIFCGCEKVANLDLLNFDTSNVTSMSMMFCGCSSLANLDLTYFDTSNVTSMYCMFCNCPFLQTIKVGGNWYVDEDADTDSMFWGCNSLVGGMGTVFDPEYVDGTYAHVDEGSDNPGYLTDGTV